MTLSNLGDLNDQICVLWQQVNFLLQEYCSHCTNWGSTKSNLPPIAHKAVKRIL